MPTPFLLSRRHTETGTNSTSMAATDELDERIQRLPQVRSPGHYMLEELAALIRDRRSYKMRLLDFTLLIDPGIVIVDSNYKPPKQLRVNRAIRQKAAKHYYATSTFELQLSAKIYSFEKVACRWLGSLAKEHQAAVTCVQATVPVDFSGLVEEYARALNFNRAESLIRVLREDYQITLCDGQFGVAFKFEGKVCHEASHFSMA